jgi:hypothetical protein
MQIPDRISAIGRYRFAWDEPAGLFFGESRYRSSQLRWIRQSRHPAAGAAHNGWPKLKSHSRFTGCNSNRRNRQIEVSVHLTRRRSESILLTRSDHMYPHGRIPRFDPAKQATRSVETGTFDMTAHVEVNSGSGLSGPELERYPGVNGWPDLGPVRGGSAGAEQRQPPPATIFGGEKGQAHPLDKTSVRLHAGTRIE